MAETTVAAPLSNEDLSGLLALIKGADSVELKLSVPLSDRTKAGAALGVDPLDGEIRQVYFFDTPDLRLNKSGVVVRARRVQRKGDDSVVKLRPVVPGELPPELRLSENFGVEVDAMPGGYVCSGSMKHAMGRQRSGKRSPAHSRYRSCSPRNKGRSMRRTLPKGSGWATSRSSARCSCSSSSSHRKSTAAGSSPSCGSTQTTRCCSSYRRNAHPPRHSRSPPKRRPS